MEGFVSYYNKLFKLPLLVMLIASLLMSCSKTERVEEPKIIAECNGIVCSLAVNSVQLERFTNLLGKNIDREISREALGGETDTLTWTIGDEEVGEYATSSLLEHRKLMRCREEECSDETNPTGFTFYNTGSYHVTAEGTVTKSDGTEEYVELHKVIKPGVSAPEILMETEDGITYKFDVDLEYTGIPEDSTFSWYVDDSDVPEATTKVFEYTFEDASTEHEIRLEIDLP